MLRIPQLDELDRICRDCVRLVDLQERRMPQFPDEVLQWLRQLESTMEANRLPRVSLIAALRSKLIASQRARPSAELTSGVDRRSRSRGLSATASAVITEAVAAVLSEVEQHRVRIDEAERLMFAAVAGGRALGLIDDRRVAAGGIDGLMRAVSVMQSHSELGPVVVRIESLVGRSDAVILLDRVLIQTRIAPQLVRYSEQWRIAT